MFEVIQALNPDTLKALTSIDSLPDMFGAHDGQVKQKAELLTLFVPICEPSLISILLDDFLPTAF